MPRISWFYGISVYVYHRDHPPPHFEAAYGEFVANVSMATGDVIEGRLPPNAARLVRRWTLMHRDELRNLWAAARANRPLTTIAGLDDDQGQSR